MRSMLSSSGVTNRDASTFAACAQSRNASPNAFSSCVDQAERARPASDTGARNVRWCARRTGAGGPSASATAAHPPRSPHCRPRQAAQAAMTAAAQLAYSNANRCGSAASSQPKPGLCAKHSVHAAICCAPGVSRGFSDELCWGFIVIGRARSRTDDYKYRIQLSRTRARRRRLDPFGNRFEFAVRWVRRCHRPLRSGGSSAPTNVDAVRGTRSVDQRLLSGWRWIVGRDTHASVINGIVEERSHQLLVGAVASRWSGTPSGDHWSAPDSGRETHPLTQSRRSTLANRSRELPVALCPRR